MKEDGVKKEVRKEKTTSQEFTRRNLLKLGGAGIAAAASAAVVERVSAAEETAKKLTTDRKLAMVIDLRKCYGCFACQVACKAEFQTPLGVFKSRVESEDKGRFPKAKRHFVPRLCNHCTNPPCIPVCPTSPKASQKREEDGVVIVDKKLCIGCEQCVPACPYNARFLHPETAIVAKCDFCLHRIEQGVVPSCVNTCPANARILGDLNDPQSKVSKLLNQYPTQVLKPESGTKPNVYYIPAQGMKKTDF